MKDLSNALQVGRSTAYKLITDGEVRHFRVGNAIRIPKLALVEYVESVMGRCNMNKCSSQANLSCHEKGVHLI